MKKFGLHLLLHLIIKQKVDSAMQSIFLSRVDPCSQLCHLQDESTEAVKIAMFSKYSRWNIKMRLEIEN